MATFEHENVTGKKLSQIVLFYFLVLFIFFTTVVLFWTYHSSNALVTEELKKKLYQQHITAETTLDYLLEDVVLSLKYIAAGNSLEEAVAEMDRDLTREILRRNLDSGIKSRFDVLFVKNMDNTIWLDDSSPFFELQSVLPFIAEHEDAGTPGQFFTFPLEHSELVVFGKSFPLIYQNTGRVVGKLFGGIVLNGDISLLESMRKKIQVDSLMLVHDGRVIASTEHTDAPIMKEAISHLPVASDDFRRLADGYLAHYQTLRVQTEPSPLKLVFVLQDSVFTNLKSFFQAEFVRIVWLVIILLCFTLYLVRRIITSPLKNLFGYATRVGQGHLALYQDGPIFEFNQIGVVMSKTVHGLQHTTEQLESEVLMRQQVMNQLRAHHQNLEQLVETRTKELSVTNENLMARNLELDREKSERLHAQDEMRQLAEAVKNSPVSIVITDENGKIEYVNPKFSELTQYSFAEAIGQTPHILSSGVHSKEYFKEIWDTLLAGQEWHGEFCNKKKDGELFWELSSISPILDDEGEIRHFVAVKEDITARKLTEETLREARLRAEEANKQKSLFLANMSHEIRTPMNALIGLSELALETRLTDQQYDYLTKIHSSSKSLLTILNDILDYSKIEAGKLELEEEHFSLPETMDELGSLFTDQAEQKGLQLRLSMEADVPPCLLGDCNRLRQVLVNLIGNGLKFTNQGTVTVAVSLVSQTDTLVRLKFSIVDTGIGIPADKLDTLFAAFSQVDASHTRQYGGTGLGLTISKQLVEMMGGRLEINSVEDQGSEFFFILDFKRSSSQGIPLQKNVLPSLEERKQDAVQQIYGARILLVEDNAVNQQVAAEILGKANIAVETAANGEEAVGKYRLSLEQDTPFAAILMDIQMPVLDGYGATAQIREQGKSHPHIPIIAMTAHTMVGDREKGIAAGMDDYIGKPINSSELLITLAKWIDKQVGEKKSDAVIAAVDGAERQLPDNLPGIHLKEGIARLEGNRELYLHLLSEFIGEFQESGTGVAELLNQKEYDRAKRLVHTIKGVAGNLGVHRLQEVAGKLEIVLLEEHNSGRDRVLRNFDLAWQELLASMNFLERKGSFINQNKFSQVLSDKENFSSLLAILLTQLGKNDFQAINSWQELKQSFNGDEWATEIAAIDHCISIFDFEKAGRLMKCFTEAG